MLSTLKAKELLTKYWNRKLPVNPKKIAEEMGIIVHENLHEASGKLSVENERVEIFVNCKEPILRQRFTVAHELGHWALDHGNAFRDFSENFRVSQHDPKEAAANRFAIEFLMPEEAVEQAIEGMGIKDIKRLANIFEVSQLAMKIRLEQLQWI